MFALDNRKSVSIIASVLFICVLLLNPSPVSAKKIGLGSAATPEEINGWDIDIRPDGKGLPDGKGDAIGGESVFIQKCAVCHGEFAEGAGRYPALAGGDGSLDTHDPVKTVGSYWPYATTVFDYIRRAMPFGHAQSLTNDEVYAMTAYILYSNDIIEDDFVLDKNTLAKVEMPNRNGFIKDTRVDEPREKPCMQNCLAKAPVIIGKARLIDVTPEGEKATTSAAENSQNTASDPVRGEAVFAAQCVVCHSTSAGENKVGPSLYGLMGRNVGKVDSFANYSAAMHSATFAWSSDSLREFLSDPQGFLPGTTMPFGGIKDSATLEDLLAFLRRSADAK